jgi:hypothetical protein
MFADNGLSDVHSFLYFPADPAQMVAIIQRVFFERGIRFVFSTRSKVPWILKEDGSRFFEDGYQFVPGKDEVIAEGKAGYVVSFGEMLYRSWDAVLRCRQLGLDVGLINKPSLNVVDEQVRFPLVVLGIALLILIVFQICLDDYEDRPESVCPCCRVAEPKDWGKRDFSHSVYG